MTSKWISVETPDGSEFDAYLSLPPTGSGPGIVLIQEIFGVNEHIRSVADQYASDGYVVLAPDLFWRQGPHFEVGYDGPQYAEGVERMKKLDMPMALSDIESTAKKLHTMDQLKGKIASVGYCLGGRLSYHAAAAHTVDAAICYYPGGVHQTLDIASDITAPIMFHFGGADDHLPPEAVEATKAAFASHENASVFVYPGAQHGFNCWARSSYHQHSAALAHGRSLVFLADAI